MRRNGRRRPATSQERSRAWGVSAALYGLRSRRNLGVGDYRDLAEAAEQVARLGADFIGINPVHAHGTAGEGFSPYSPTCRSALEPRHIAPDAVPGFEGCAEVRRLLEERIADLEAEKAGALVDYAAQRRRQHQALEALYRSATESHGPAAADFAAWREGPGGALEWFAVFEAIACVHGPDWRSWPQSLRSAEGARRSNALPSENEAPVRYHAWLQWLAGRQVAGAQAAARDAGMALGLYLDLAVGVRPGGADTWAAPACYARGVSLGAPPDAFSPGGPDLEPRALQSLGLARRGLPALHPDAAGHDGPCRNRPDRPRPGARSQLLGPGVRCPGWLRELPARTLACPRPHRGGASRLCRRRRGSGFGPEGSAPAPRQGRIAGLCGHCTFERDGRGFRPPRRYRPASLASAGTHDTPTLKGWWSGRDLDLRHRLGQHTAEECRAALAARAAERGALCRLLVEEGHAPANLDPAAPPPEADGAIVVAVHALLAGAGSLAARRPARRRAGYPRAAEPARHDRRAPQLAPPIPGGGGKRLPVIRAWRAIASVANSREVRHP